MLVLADVDKLNPCKNSIKSNKKGCVNMKKIIVYLFLICVVCLSGCSSANLNDNSNSNPEPETVIVKETVIVTETVYVTEPNNDEKIEPTTLEESESKGYTTQEILKRAANTSEKQYWILYYCDNKLRMQSFNALEGFTVTLRSDQHLKCDRLVGDVTLYYWDEEKSDFSITNTTAYGDWSCNDIIGGNVDVIDEKNDKTISAKTE